MITVTRIGERRSVLRLLVHVNVVPSSPMLATLMMETIHFSETSVIRRATRRTIPEDGILHSHRRENIKLHSINRLGLVAET
jgi:hypothetical protein